MLTLVRKALPSKYSSFRVFGRGLGLPPAESIDQLPRPASQSLSFSSYPGDEDDDDVGRPKTALVLGSSGALGSAVSHYLSQTAGMKVIGADVRELPGELNGDWELDGFVPLPKDSTLGDLTTRLVQGVDFYLQDTKSGLDAIVCASGGWQGDPAPPLEGSKDDIEKGALAYAETIQDMLRMNLDPVLATGYLAQQYMGPNGLLVVIGATAAILPTPGMLGYGVSKAGAHHFVQTMGAMTGQGLESKSIRRQGRKTRQYFPNLDTLHVVGILPSTIDTPSNRKADPEANFDQWTKPLDIAKEIGSWVQKTPLRPHSGSLVKVYTKRDRSGAGFELVR